MHDQPDGIARVIEITVRIAGTDDVTKLQVDMLNPDDLAAWARIVRPPNQFISGRALRDRGTVDASDIARRDSMIDAAFAANS